MAPRNSSKTGTDAQAPAYDPEAIYSVTVSAVAEYRGTVLSPMHNPHEVKGKVAEAIADKIASAEKL